MIVAAIFTVLSIIGALVTSIQTLLTVMFRRRPRPFAGGLHEQASRPDASSASVSILKPVCGLDDGLEQNLLSFLSLHDIRYEVILSIEDRDDPAMPIATAMVRDHPDVFRLVTGGGSRRGVVNRKVERLIAAARVARGDIFLISDSNVRVDRDDVSDTISVFADKQIGCVSNLFIGDGARDLGATIETLHLMTFVAPGAVLAASAGVPCVVGKSMAISRRALNAIGGFEAFRHVLAEDQAIGLAVRAAGFEVGLSRVRVRNVIERRTIKRALDRQIRWNKIRYSFSRTLFSSELILNPLPLAIAAVIFGAPLALLAIIMLARIVQGLLLRDALDASLSVRQVCAIPLLDFVMFYAWFIPFFSNRITWRGYEARIERGTELVQAA
jgi:ceramide glucosyltransferase